MQTAGTLTDTYPAMIISHAHRFIFLKTAKTAGTSIEIALAKFCGTADVITPITRKDEALRSRHGARGSQHHLAPWSDYRGTDLARLLLRGKRKLRFYNHMPAREILQFIDRSTWDSYFKFCFERNPWDRVLSYYYMKNRSEPRQPLAEFLASGMPLRLRETGLDLYTLDGEVAVDRVCRYEELDEELERVRQLIGLPEALSTPRAKGSYRKEKRSYREILGTAEAERIAEMFATEIALFGYTFDPPGTPS